ncbi:c-type cytochrome biogenesis protein CcmI [Methylomonas sp. SURF-2]|uniref:C-type cytochrome biogenesis protein CcmI n=1 Tax=Methylomonas subterranea TaxID=2952225 RepID=A0ABT1TH97_9GAMM|nr:c-type cytochrome biogenesis protein CcmI [Methylomonas sp. SURF-2]MCQ8104694.1 c-type cytochrome biogenesis protein CcmI [Methylomonas sp. SURF-2]
MNTLFWLIVAGLILIALAMLVPALLTKQLPVDDGHQQRNIKIARQRLTELKQQLQEGALTQTQFDEQYAELQLILSDDIESAVHTPASKSRGRWVIPLLALLLPCLSLFIYLMLGDANALNKIELQANQTKAAENVAQMIAKLEQRLQQQPEDIEGWKMLGRSYSYLQQYQQAAEVYAKLYASQPQDSDVQLQYANSLAMSRGGRMSGEPEQLIDLVLQKHPDDDNALWLAGVARAERGEYRQAKQYWEKLAGLLPAGSESLPQVRQMLAALDAELAKQAGAVPAIEIPLRVELDPALKNLPAADSTVFIYAQALTGPKMPLAIARKQLADLPLELVLNDSMAMQADTHLGNYQQLRIVARVSQSGQAATQPGDLIGSVEISQPFAAQTARILINQAVE